MSTPQRIACWMSDKKLQKINWNELERTCHRYGFNIFKLNLNEDLESQGTFCVLLHKLTDIIAAANQGDEKCIKLIEKIENYLIKNPRIVVIDPIENVRKLLNRYISYSKINSTDLYKYGIFTPNFCNITTTNIEIIKHELLLNNINYPFICKHYIGHGSRAAHEMSIIFNEKYLTDCKPPCIAQTFINHNAKLYKLFIVGEKFHYVERPSIKNFYLNYNNFGNVDSDDDDDDKRTIFFDSSDVSKAGSTSNLSILDPDDRNFLIKINQPDRNIFEIITKTLRLEFGMDLLGIDVVIENTTGKYAIIDINAYPGYDGFPNFYEALLECITNKINNKRLNDHDNNHRIDDFIEEFV